MSLEARLARTLVERHPARAAAVLERAASAEAVRILANVPVLHAAAVIGRMPPKDAARTIEAFEDARGAGVLAVLPLDVAARLGRRIGEPRRADLFARLPSRVAASLETLLRFPENTAGAIMDPSVLALAADLPVREALRRVREASEYAQYNLYVVDREQRLVGVLNLRELLRARPRATLEEIMIRDPARLAASDDRTAILGNPSWRDVRALPVVDDRGGYLGAIRFRVVRQLEDELLGSRKPDLDTGAALGEVFAAGATGLLEALTSPSDERTRGR